MEKSSQNPEQRQSRIQLFKNITDLDRLFPNGTWYLPIPDGSKDHGEELHFYNLFELAPIGMAIIDREKNILYANNWFSRLFGTEEVPHRSLNFYDLVCDKDYSKIHTMDNVLLNSARGFYESNLALIRNDGGLFNARIYAYSFKDEQNIVRYIAVFINTLSTNKTSEVLDKINARIQEMVQSAPIAIIGTDLNGNILAWNPAAEKLFGWKEEEVIGKRSPAVSEEKYSEAFSLYEKLLSGQSIACFEARRKKKDGSHVDISIWGAPLYGIDGNVISIMTMIFDITEQKHVEQSLRRAKEVAEFAIRTKNMFLANISHEIRTPIAAIAGVSELMLDKNEEKILNTNEGLNIIQRNSRHLLSLVDDLLDFAKAEADQLEIKREKFNIQNEVDAAIAAIKTRADLKNLSLMVKKTASTPNKIVSDPIRFRQILINLLNNAVKFTEKGSIEIEISFRYGEGATGMRNWLEIFVADTGIGIPEQQREQIFDLFSQVDPTTSRRFGGVGLGLTLSRKLAQALGGDLILFDSLLGKGSKFKLTIDAGDRSSEEDLDDDNAKKETSSNNDDMSGKGKELQDAKILIADDCEDICFLLQRFLDNAGAQTECVFNGKDAVSLALTKLYDLVIMDIQMPEMDGLEATTILRKNGFPNPILVLTAHAMMDERERCLSVGCDDYLSKPVSRQVLIDTIKTHIEKKAPRK